MSKMWASGLVLAAALMSSVTGMAEPGKTGKFDQALSAVERLDFRKAGKFFSREMDKHKVGSQEWLKAALGYAVSLHRRQPDTASDKEEAAELYRKIVRYAKASGSKYYPIALIMQGKLYEAVDYFEDRPNTKGAYVCYDTVIKECPKSHLIQYAALCRSRLLIFDQDKAQVEKGIKQLTVWLKKYPSNRFAATEWLLIADAYRYPMIEYKRSLSALLQAEKAGLPAGQLKDVFYWKVAKTAVQAGNQSVAMIYLNRIVAMGNSRFGTVANDLLKTLNPSAKGRK